jgi:hypothetical protein
MVPVEAVEDVASPLAPKVAIPLTDKVLPRLAAPVTPIVVPTYSALAIAAPPPITTPPETDAEDASPLEDSVLIPATDNVVPTEAELKKLAAPVTVSVPPMVDVPATLRLKPT